ncbi:hypothetical protein, partial [Lactobacillus psittaci]|uniref:hypothetical protein n=1 Tax=Lactobacillus psittaci TaxID=116089 RepID=UPI0030843839
MTPDQTIKRYEIGEPLTNTGDADTDLNPFDKTTVKDADKLTDEEKGQVAKNIKKTNGDKHISTVEVKDNGRTIVTYEDGTQKELTPDQTIISSKLGDPLINSGEADTDLNSFDKTTVKDADKLTDEEKGKVAENIKKTNGDKHISTVDVKDNGRTIVTFEDGTQKELTPDQTIISSKLGEPLTNTGDADADLNSFDKTTVKDADKLTDEEKGQVAKN